jgi:hypothetical protein
MVKLTSPLLSSDFDENLEMFDLERLNFDDVEGQSEPCIASIKNKLEET